MLRSLTAITLLAATSVADAHSPWLYVTEDSEARLFFGEGPGDREYHLPDAVAGAEVWQDAIDAPAKHLEMSPLEEEGFVGLEADSAIEPRGVVRTTITYGVYNGLKLVYDAQHFPAENPEAWPTEPPTKSGLAATLRLDSDRLLATFWLDGEPLPGAEATLAHEDGGDPVEATADDQGVAAFPADAVRDGLNGLSVMRVDNQAEGEVEGTPYSGAMRLLTATFNYRAEEAAKVSVLPPHPEAVASFGAAACDGWLYVYGGHVGQAHDHSRDNLSGRFRRVRLDGEGAWEELPAGPALQGLALVAHGGKLYRVGGLDARNASGADEDLHSVDAFACYDPAAGEWTDLPALPGPRSSHNAVVLDGKLYVVGGWGLSGSSDGAWRSGALAYDLQEPSAEWVTLPAAPFKRRALAVSHADGRVAVLCGMTDEADLSRQVFFYDPASREWSEGPEFPGAAFHGFGLAAWNLDGDLYAGGMEGVLYRLDSDRGEWVKADEFQTKRFFHQLVPDGRGGLLAVAGASPELGHTGSIERLEPTDDADKTPSTAAAEDAAAEPNDAA